MKNDEDAVTMELMYGVLKKLQDGQRKLIDGQRDIKENLISLRSDNVRLERGLMDVEHDIERLKNRLDVSD